jgi:hypothetical protein
MKTYDLEQERIHWIPEGHEPEQLDAVIDDERKTCAEERKERLLESCCKEDRLSSQELGCQKEDDRRGDQQAVRLRGGVIGTPPSRDINEMECKKGYVEQHPCESAA